MTEEITQGEALVQIEVPRIVIPRINDDAIRKHRIGKFVGILIGEEPHMMFGREGSYHSNLLKAMLEQFGLRYDLQESEDGDKMIPKPLGDGYKAVSMGRFMMGRNSVILHGDSDDYGLTPNPEFLEQMKLYLPEDLIFELR